MAKENNNEVSYEKIKIFSFNLKHREKPYFITGVEDVARRILLTGKEDLSPEQQKVKGVELDAKDNYSIRHNQTLTLTKKGDIYVNDYDYAIYCLCTVQPNIAMSLKACVVGIHDYYLQNFEAEAIVEATNSKLQIKAGSKFLDMSLAEMIDFLYFKGENAGLYSSNVAERLCYDYAKKDPAGTIKYFDDLENNQRVVFVKKLLSKGFIKKAENGYLFYNKTSLGSNDSEAAAFLYADKNEHLYIPLKDMLEKSK